MGDQHVVSTDPTRSASTDWAAKRNFKRLSLPVPLTSTSTGTETETNLRRVSNRLSLGSDAPINSVEDLSVSHSSSERKQPLSSLRSLDRDYEVYNMRCTSSVEHEVYSMDDNVSQYNEKVDNSVVIEKLASREKGNDPDQGKARFLPDGGRLLGAMYAFVLALVGTALPLREALTGKWLTDYVHAVFLVYVYGVGLIFLLGVEIYLVRAASRRRQLFEDASKKNTKKTKPTPRVPSSPSKGVVNLAYEPDPSAARANREHLGAQAGRPMWYKRHMSLSDLRQLSVVSEQSDGAYIIEPDSHWDFPLPHHTSLYLRIGVTLFGLATMVYDGLLVKQLHDHSSPSSCEADTLIWPHYVHLAFLLMQTFFIFKHPQIQVSAGKPLVRIGFMHLLATNWCFWVRTLIRETLNKQLHNDWLQERAAILASNATVAPSTVSDCAYEDDILYKAVPYIFPCLLEYSLLAGAAMYNMYSSIGFQLHAADGSDGGSQHAGPNTTTRKRNHMTEISFHRTHRGLFLGIVVLAGTIVSTILFFSYMNKATDDDNPKADDDQDTTLLIYSVTDIAIMALLLVMTCLAWVQIRRLTYIQFLRGIMLDEALLLLAMGGNVLFHLLRVMPIIDDMIDNDHTDTGNILAVVECLLSMVAVIFQTAFVVDGVCRFVTSNQLWENKPGRGSLTFLLCANLAMWMLRSFQLKQLDIDSVLQVQDYGHLAWVLAQYVCIPLLVFYHYHCSACIAHIWSCAYKKDLVKDPQDHVPLADISRDFAEKGFVPDSSWTHIDLDEEHQASREPGKRRVLHRSPIDVVRMKSPVSEV